MDAWPLSLLVISLSFACGSIPFAWITTKAVRGVDLRTVGSGNVGATNAARVLGRQWFLFVFILDALKGALPLLLFPALANLGTTGSVRLGMACGLAAILGHVFCPWLGWKGGKGVATGAGVLGALAPLPSLVALVAFLAMLRWSRYVSLASCAACVVLGPAAFAFRADSEVAVFCIVVGALVIWLHRPNLARIAAGTEPQVFKKRPTAAGEPQDLKKEVPPHA